MHQPLARRLRRPRVLGECRHRHSPALAGRSLPRRHRPRSRAHHRARHRRLAARRRPFSNLGISNITDLSGLRIESRVVNGVTPGAFSLDDIEIVGNDEYNGVTTATITLTNLEQTYTGAPRPVTATTTPAGLPVLLTYNGSSTAPTAVGTYAVSAVIDDPAIIGSATGSLVISKATATILLGNLAPAADGTPKTPTATTNPPGLAVSFTFNGSATAPTYPGSYAVVATINDANYQGSTSSTMLIRQLALPPTGITNWASNIAGKVTAETTSSPLFNPNDTADQYSTNTLQAFFSPITLANTGDKITLTGGFQLSAAGIANQGNWFRFGLFDNRGQAPNIITAWSGYAGMGYLASGAHHRRQRPVQQRCRRHSAHSRCQPHTHRRQFPVRHATGHLRGNHHPHRHRRGPHLPHQTH